MLGSSSQTTPLPAVSIWSVLQGSWFLWWTHQTASQLQTAAGSWIENKTRSNHLWLSTKDWGNPSRENGFIRKGKYMGWWGAWPQVNQILHKIRFWINSDVKFTRTRVPMSRRENPWSPHTIGTHSESLHPWEKLYRYIAMVSTHEPVVLSNYGQITRALWALIS